MVGIDFIQDLGLVMLVAATAGWLCRRLGLPLILGYITAGILIGPHMPFFVMVDDTNRIHALAQVGLVFLIFQIGQGLQLQRLKSMGLPLVLATFIIAIFVFNGSRLLAYLLGWPPVYGLVLAGMLMVSSTAIIGKTLRENNALHSIFGQTALTVTALDDLVAVVMLTLLSVIQTSAAVAPGALLETIFRLAAVMATMLIVALLAVPPLIKRLNRNTSGELRTLFIVGLLLAMALLSTKAGFSAAIGAFLLGSVVASTGHKAQVEQSLGGLCEVFGALFFVAVGMLFELKLLAGVWPLVLLVFAFALLWRSFASSLALLVVGQQTGDAVRAGICLTPIGEFSLIIALAAVQARIVPDWFYALAIGLCLLSTLTTPIIIRHPGRFSDGFERWQPEFVRKAVEFYHDWVESFRHRQRSSLFWRLTGPRWLQLAGEVLFISGLLIFAQPGYRLIAQWLSPDWPAPIGLPALFWLGFLLLLLVPLVALWRTVEVISMICAEAATRGHRHRDKLQPAFEKLLHGAAYVLILAWVSIFVPYESLPRKSLFAFLAVAVALTLLFWRKLVRWHSRFQIDLRAHLQGSAFAAPGVSRANWQQHSERWHLRAREHVVGEQTRAAGKAIHDLPLRQMFSANIVGIERQGYHLPNPEPNTVLYPNDKLLLLGAEKDLRQAERWLSALEPQPASGNGREPSFADLCLEPLLVPASSRHIGKSLGELKLTQQLGIQVVGLEREDDTRLTVGKFDTLKAGDRLLVLGTQKQITDMAFWLAT
ncbi:MAG: cation:proton antiporter [Verrucomicrobia bacterium]|nr:cation:proton antiporter [Verrucomicrobiota bacterium]OQC26170.1 MAG: Inner membrane protein YbaL [Verrucomicrobia bacterium ADurb.Bin063]MBP8015523.1 cation:proton antiporter [Verrucomicrobiota bacterium]HOC49870.1 cation:proton antiporter [Verrucomicrobiota bacterium]HPW91358.1 cation:proton antiporter [Verrucomicrobiota bacterium]